MKRLTSLGNGLKGLSKLSAGVMVAAAFGASACDEETGSRDAGVDPELGVNFEELGTPVEDCTEASTTDFNATTKVLNVSIDDEVDAVISVVNGKLKINGNQCQTDATPPVDLTSTNVTRLNVTAVGTAKVVIDLLPGTFGNIFAGTGAIVITGTDPGKTLSVGVRGTAQANLVKMSETVNAGVVNYFMELSGDTRADLKIVPAAATFPTISLALGEGADSFTAQGQSLTLPTGLGSGTQTSVSDTQAITVFGGAGNDTLKGGLGDDTLNGGDGNDLFQTTATTATVTEDGADVYVGGSGTDTIDYSGRTEAVVVSIAPTEENGWVKGVNIFDPALIVAASDELTYTVGAGAPVVLPFPGTPTSGAEDILAFLAANLVGCTASVNDRGELILKNDAVGAMAVAASEAGTTLFGGAKTNNGTTALLADPDDGKAGEADDVRGDVENITGGTAGDTLTGSASPNLINGGAGADNISGGIAGALCTGVGADTDSLNGGDGNDIFQMGFAPNCSDILDGGAGSDIANYEMRTNGLTIDIDGSADDGESENDNIKTTVEGVMGGSGADSITGGTAADDLHGGGGNDTLTGGTGNDSICGGPGDDLLLGGVGEDYFNEKDTHDPVYAGTAVIAGGGGDVLNGGADVDKGDFARAAAMVVTLCSSTNVTGSGACGGDPANDTADNDDITNVEYFVGGAAADQITGSTADDIIEGGGDNDTISGGNGNDTLYGEAGADSLMGGAGEDIIDGAAGVNELFGGDGEGDICTLGGAGSTKDVACEL